MARKRKKSPPLAIFWTRRDQLRFIDAVEKLVGLVGDLTLLLERHKRKPRAKQPSGAANGVNRILAPEEGGPPY